MPRPVRRDGGEGAVAYIAILLLVALITTGLVTGNVGGQVAGEIKSTVCSVAQQKCPAPSGTATAEPVLGGGTSASPSPAGPDGRTQAALTYLRKFLAFLKQSGRDSGPTQQGALYNLLHDLQGLTPAELNTLLAQLTPAELAQLNDFLSHFTWTPFGVPRDAPQQNPKVTLASLLLSEADPAQLARLLAAMPSLRPDRGDSEVKAGDLTWANSNEPLFGQGGPNINDVVQGNLGDCWFLGSLAAVVQADPDFIRNHIHQNANGTYTVTLYENGKPVQVTVDPALPSGDGSTPEYAQTPGDDWVAIYEKALAAQMGDEYGNTEGNQGKTGLDLITGQGASQSSPSGYLNGWLFGLGSVSLGDVQKDLDHGEAVVTGSNSKPGEHNVVGGHLYTVVSVNPDGHPPTITLRNPWGPGAPAKTPEYITLTEDQWHDNYDEIAGVKP